MQEKIARLARLADRLRLDVVEMIGVGKVGHLGGSCSLAEITAVLYGEVMCTQGEQRDRFLLSKGHAAPIQYAALAECGIIDRSLFAGLKTLGNPLQGHPDRRKLAGIEGNTGSLGQGVSMACGMAAGLRLDGSPARVYAVVGDGELAEGQLWEAFMSAARYRLDNLCVIVDRNHLQATAPTAELFSIENISAKFAAFGFHVIETDGHNVESLLAAFAEAAATKGKPTVVIAETVKGKGIPFAENQVGFHNSALTAEQYEQAVAVLRERLGDAQ